MERGVSQPSESCGGGSSSYGDSGSSVGGRRALPKPSIQVPDLELDAELLDVVSFGNNPTLLRATDLTTVLSSGARIFNSSRGDADSYALSRRAKGIDVFISHNWTVGRRQKFVALALYFQLWPALATFCLVQLLLVLLTISGALPSMHVPWTRYPRGVACKLLGVPLFLAVLFFSEDLGICCGKGAGKHAGPRVFLDRCCIHQGDPELQVRGLEKMGAFLAYSQRLFVIYTEHYLTRLWTVYEFACFVSLKPVDRVELIPTIMAQTVVQVCIMLSVWLPLVTVAEILINFDYSLEIIFLVAWPLIANCFRLEARERHEVRKRCESFSVRACVCECDEDRSLIYRNISELMRGVKVVSPNASQDQALDAFDELARAKLPRLLERAAGRHGNRYVDFMLLSFLMWASYWFDTMVGFAYGMHWSECLSEVGLAVTVMFALDPLIFALVAETTGRCLSLQGASERGFVCGVAWLGTLLSGLCVLVLVHVGAASSFRSQGKADGLFVMAMGLALLIWLATAWAFGFFSAFKKKLPKCMRGDGGPPKNRWLWEKGEQRASFTDSDQHAARPPSTVLGMRSHDEPPPSFVPEPAVPAADEEAQPAPRPQQLAREGGEFSNPAVWEESRASPSGKSTGGAGGVDALLSGRARRLQEMH